MSSRSEGAEAPVAARRAPAREANVFVRFARWAFVDRTSGRIVIVQLPNVPLIVFLVASIAARLTDGTAATVLAVVATLALVVWALDEIVRGVNPWRRTLGAVVLIASLFMALHR